MSQEKTGGPAFPAEITEQFYCMGPQSKKVQHPGMTLRDYFAAHAPATSTDMLLTEHCAYRYRYADAMIAAREAAPSSAAGKEGGDRG